MALADKLAAWQQAGIIDAETAARIAAHEDASARPFALWAVIGLGCLALALGLISVVAANWTDIPDVLKLVVHFTLSAAAALAVWFGVRRDARWFAEGALFLLAALILTGLALHSQIYQLSGDIWKLLMTWLALSAPVLLLAGRTRLTAYALAGMTLWATIGWASAQVGETLSAHLVEGLAMAVPWLLLAIPALIRERRRFIHGLVEVALIVLLIGVSLAHMAWADPVTGAAASDMRVRMALVAVVAMAALWAQRRRGPLPQPLHLPMVAVPFVALFLATALPHGDGPLPRFFGALVFAGMWGWIAWAAARLGWRSLFGIAIGALAIRLFIVYFELFGSLAMTGAGLIFAGVLLIGLALGWRRIFQTFRRNAP
jgi:uncharacterized membrane protein|tara:strand:+ start:3185 stop:4303 length:1119 start_codon:yes stop_codon:yes gene_type:complete